MAAKDTPVVVAAVVPAERKPAAHKARKSKKKPVLFEFHVDGMDATIEVSSLSPLRAHADIRKGGKEGLHVEVRAAKNVLALGDVLKSDAMREQIVNLLDTFRGIVAQPAPDLPSDTATLPAPAPKGLDSHTRHERAFKAGREAARAKAEDLGVLQLHEATMQINEAFRKAYDDAYMAKEPAPEAAE